MDDETCGLASGAVSLYSMLVSSACLDWTAKFCCTAGSRGCCVDKVFRKAGRLPDDRRGGMKWFG